MNPLANTSILLSLEIRKWAGEVSDKKALAAIAKEFKSDTHNDKYRKSLFVTDALHMVDRCAGRLRNQFYYYTVPWLDGGKGRLIPSQKFQEFSKEHIKYKKDFFDEVETFISAYPEHLEKAKEHKGDLFSAAEYPQIDQLRNKFGVTLNALPFPNTKDIRLDAPSEIINELTQTMDESIARVGNVVSTQLSLRFHERLAMLAKTLRVGKRFNSTLLTELGFVIDMAFDLQHTLDPNLYSNMEFVRERVLKYDPDQIRNSENLQEELLTICEGIIK